MDNAFVSKIKSMLKEEKYRQFLRFAVVGVINTGVTFLVYSLCVGVFQINPYVSQVFGYTAGVLNSYVLNKVWTFGSRSVSRKTTMEFVQFVVVNLLSLGMTLLGLGILINKYGINKYLAQIGTTFFGQLVNFFGYKLWVFKK